MRAYASASKEECNNADAEAALSLRALEYEATGKKGTVTAAEVAMHVAALKRYRGHRAVVIDLGKAKKRPWQRKQELLMQLLGGEEAYRRYHQAKQARTRARLTKAKEEAKAAAQERQQQQRGEGAARAQAGVSREGGEPAAAL